MDSYDEIPYQSTPFHESHPGFLAPLAALFGLEPAPPERCRVLELGCASGGNVIPMAWHLPGSEFLGIKLSGEQAAAGAARVAELGLNNCEIRQGDILQLDASLGRFDYIVAHGVYSWTPAPVRDRLLALCGELLSEQGVAYVSYNTLPGWRMRGMLRDLVGYHTRGLERPGERLEAARGLLEAMAPAYAAMGSLSARYLGVEIDRLLNEHPSYLFHEYLEEHNHPVLFADFVAHAEGHGLRYVCETELHTLFPSTLDDPAAEFLNRVPGNLAMWQYMDFLVNRNFRQSLLCRADTPLREDPDMDAFIGCAFAADLRPPRKLDLRRAKAAPFSGADGTPRDVHHPLTKAALAYLYQVFPSSVPAPELAEHAVAAVRAAGNSAAAQETDHLASELFGLYAHQAVAADLAPRRAAAPAAPPRATALARAYAAEGQLPTFRHASLKLDRFGTRLVELLDGTRNPEALIADLAREFTDAGEKAIRANVERLLALFARHGVLEEEGRLG